MSIVTICWGYCDVEKIKSYINSCNIGGWAIIIILLCLGCYFYFAGRNSAERDANIQRIQSTQQQLNNATEQLDKAVRENKSARRIVTDSIVVNERIEQRIDSSETAVSRSEEANARASAAVAEAERIITVAKSTATESERIAGDSKSILERAKRRTEEKTSAR